MVSFDLNDLDEGIISNGGKADSLSSSIDNSLSPHEDKEWRSMTYFQQR